MPDSSLRSKRGSMRQNMSGAERDVPGGGEPIGQLPNVVVDPEDLLEDQNSGPGAGLGKRAVGVELAAVKGCDAFVPVDRHGEES